MVRDGRDDIGSTVTSFCSVSLEPPMVAVSIAESAYLAEVLGRRDRWSVTVLSAGQRALAGRFSAAGRPGARLLLANVPHHRGALSDALVIEGGMAALECETRQRVAVGDHVLFVAEVIGIDDQGAAGGGTAGDPLIRVGRRYR